MYRSSHFLYCSDDDNDDDDVYYLYSVNVHIVMSSLVRLSREEGKGPDEGKDKVTVSSSSYIAPRVTDFIRESGLSEVCTLDLI